MKVQDIMSREPATCGPEDSLNRASEIMWNRDVGCLPVVDDTSCLRAMITDRDVCMAAYTQGRRLVDLSVSVAMSGEVRACRPDDAVEVAEQTMLEHQVRRLPVIDEHRHVVGVLSISDIVRACARGLPAGRSGLRSDYVVRTLGAVCAPRVCGIEDVPTGAASSQAPKLELLAGAHA